MTAALTKKDFDVVLPPPSSEADIIQCIHAAIAYAKHSDPEIKIAMEFKGIIVPVSAHMTEVGIFNDFMIKQKIAGHVLKVRDPEAWADDVATFDCGPYTREIVARLAGTWARLMQAEMAQGAKLEDVIYRTREEAAYRGNSEGQYKFAADLLARNWTHSQDFVAAYHANKPPAATAKGSLMAGLGAGSASRPATGLDGGP